MPKKSIDHLVAYLTTISYHAGKNKRKEDHKDFKEIFSVAALISKIMYHRPLSLRDLNRANEIRSIVAFNIRE